MKKTQEFLYDVRIVERHLKEGVISKKEHDKYISGLPDVEDNSEPLIIEDDNVSTSQELEESQEEEIE